MEDKNIRPHSLRFTQQLLLVPFLLFFRGLAKISSLKRLLFFQLLCSGILSGFKQMYLNRF